MATRAPIEVDLALGKRRAKPGKRGWPAQGWQAAGDGPRVVALGDSVTYGVGDEDEHAHDSGWAAYLAHALGASYFLNTARMGARARTITFEQIQAARAAQPDLALILVGGNDVLRGDFKHTEVLEHVTATIQTLQADGTCVVLLRLHDPRRTLPFPRVVREAIGRRVDRVNQALDQAAAQTGCIYINLTTNERIYEPEAWHVDRMHIGPAGHRYLATVVLSALPVQKFPVREQIPEPTEVPLTKGQQVWWLIRRGTPWVLRRSIDLIPSMIVLIAYESIRARVESRRLRKQARK
ncbi:MAG: hypothetical protein RL745_620 [Actinomycetota bacterium]